MVLISLLAGVLTVLAPCVLPLLPVIVGGSLAGRHPARPYIICTSLLVSLMTFTLLLKVGATALQINPRWLAIISGVIVVGLGIAMIFPEQWARISSRFGGHRAHAALQRAQRMETMCAPGPAGDPAESTGPTSSAQPSKKATTLTTTARPRLHLGAAILTGAALGPVFSSCSPTYAWIIASVLPVSLSQGLVYMTAYCIGVAGALLSIALVGRSLIDRLRPAWEPGGWWLRAIGVLFIVVGLAVGTGVDQRFQLWAAQNVPGLSALEDGLLPLAAEPGRDGRATSSETIAPLVPNPNAAPAPELTEIAHWINSDPLTMEQLRGKVVLIDFWTYSCINCMRTQPYLNAWQKEYADDGLVIIGVHAPEFAFEKDPANVEAAVKDAGITYPVAMDNDYGTWRAYQNRYWPAKYLIDKEGRIQYWHFGEGEYGRIEHYIRDLLGTEGATARVSEPVEEAGDEQSPETYLGILRSDGYVGEQTYQSGEQDYRPYPAQDLAISQWTLSGQWNADEESLTAASPRAHLTYRFAGQHMFLVMGGPPGARVEVTVNGERQSLGQDAPGGVVTLDSTRLYRLVDLGERRQDTLVTLTFDQGVRAYAFTFG